MPQCDDLASSSDVGVRPHGWQELPVLSCYCADHLQLSQALYCIMSR